MSIPEKVVEVERVFAELDEEISRFKVETGLGCIKGCGECCKKPDIEATVLEFLPMAYHLCQINREIEVLEALEKRDHLPTCTFFSTIISGHEIGLCNNYLHRGLICRLFGFSASKDKEGRPVLATCRIIKTNLATEYQNAVTYIHEGGFVPVMNQYYMKLLSIDHDLGQTFYPINKAIKIAIEKLSLYISYSKQEGV
ncbi:YkgJ family cysteine cluster protein [soil metagenome]